VAHFSQPETRLYIEGEFRDAQGGGGREMGLQGFEEYLETKMLGLPG
jgi:hypothetical protein